jgi:protein phosphatase
MLPEVEVVIATDPGRDPDKRINEDTAIEGETPIGHLLVLCDGMGGHEGGREASRLAVDSVFRYLATAPLRLDIPPIVRARELLRDAVGVANREVFAMGQGQPSSSPRLRPGSTLVLALVHSLGTEVAHVGDSRCYFLHEGEIRQVTKDHSMVQELVDAHKLTAAEAAHHPDSNMITRALGMSPGVEVELQRATIPHVAGDVVLLCSDGLSDLVSAQDIRDCIARVGWKASAAALVALANERGGYDNITVALMQIRENALTEAPQATQPMGFRSTEAMPAFALGAPPAAAPAPSPGLADTLPLVPPGPPRSQPPKRHALSPVVIGLLALFSLVVIAGIVLLVMRAGSDEERATVGAQPTRAAAAAHDVDAAAQPHKKKRKE